MANHKRGRSKNQRAGCKLCKPWKVNGVGKGGNLGDLPEKYSDFNKRMVADQDINSMYDEVINAPMFIIEAETKIENDGDEDEM